MASYENIGINPNISVGNNMQQPIQFPYSNQLANNPYNNYMNPQIMQQQQQRPQNQFLKCRPVSSREEAMAFQIDLDGSLWVFPNVGNGKIYTKQINNDGTATFSTYTLTKNENPFNSGDYVTKEQFNKVIQSLMAAIAPGKTEDASALNNNNESKTINF